ncbi:uncharacterized protein SOCE26_054630 [Sorangium cellulosum]|uniref:Uncharacterized protein n=1 Tax=Sorangium cellulosum TaxID=56 RepID=A0A2L0EXG2_SORCE|nr:hypothetical protein [Sorangium cellulosum]AUX44004.1 uncharacterized protein SOCE26_054630 [Sorangium cellulosum]
MATTKTKPKSKNTQSSASVRQIFTTSDANEAYRHFLPRVQAEVPADRAEICRLSVELVRANVDRGVSAIRPHLGRVREKLPLCPIDDLLELPSLALGLVAAAGRIAAAASEREIEARLEKFRPMRDLTLRQLEIFADLKLVPKQRVAAIRRGSGPVDHARDGVDIAGMFHELADTLAGKHPFSPDYLAVMAEHANWLLVQLRPRGAQQRPSERSPEAVVRDQFWTVLNQRYDHLREAGVAAFGLRQLDTNIPPIGARTQSPSTAQPPQPPGTTTPEGADPGPPGEL